VLELFDIFSFKRKSTEDELFFYVLFGLTQKKKYRKQSCMKTEDIPVAIHLVKIMRVNTTSFKQKFYSYLLPAIAVSSAGFRHQ
jgi:hypothetical protein